MKGSDWLFLIFVAMFILSPILTVLLAAHVIAIDTVFGTNFAPGTDKLWSMTATGFVIFLWGMVGYLILKFRREKRVSQQATKVAGFTITYVPEKKP